jgi:hypothetical protein
VAEIRRRAGELGVKRLHGEVSVDVNITDLEEHRVVVKRLRDWNYSEHVISETLYGNMPCPTGPKVFSKQALALMERLRRSDKPLLLVQNVTRGPDEDYEEPVI